MTLDDDRARLARIRHDHLYDVDLGRWDDDETWLLRMAEDGIRARAALADVEALCAAARAGLSIPPIDCTNSCSDGPCDCSGLFRVRAWDLDPDAVRTAIRAHAEPYPPSAWVDGLEVAARIAETAPEPCLCAGHYMACDEPCPDFWLPDVPMSPDKSHAETAPEEGP